MNKIKTLIALAAVLASQNAKALTCQGYTGHGGQIPVKATINFLVSRSPDSSAGHTIVYVGHKQHEFYSKYGHGVEHTRCVAGETLYTHLKGQLDVSLYAFNACDPSNDLPGNFHFKGSMTLYDSQGLGKTIFLGCKD